MLLFMTNIFRVKDRRKAMKKNRSNIIKTHRSLEAGKAGGQGEGRKWVPKQRKGQVVLMLHSTIGQLHSMTAIHFKIIRGETFEGSITGYNI